MGIRATFEIKTRFGGLTEVEIHSAGYAGAVRELSTQAGETLQHNYDNLNPEELFKTPIIKSRVNCTVMIRDATDRAVIDEIIAANEGQFTLKYDKGGADYWIGDIVPYLGDIAVRAFPYPVRLTAKDFTPLNGIIYPLSDERKPIIEVIAEIMNLMGYDLPITTSTSWVNSGQSNTARDFLGQIYIDSRAIREYATREEDSDRPILAITALELLCRNFKLFAKIAENRLFLDQLSAYDTPTSVLRTLYDKDGAYVSSSNVDTTVTAPSSSPYRQIAIGSTESFNPAYKRVSYTFNHRQRLQGIVFPEVFRLPESGLTSREFTQFFEPDGVKAITVTSYASLGYLVASTETPNARVQIKSGSYYFNRVTGQWTTTPYINEFPLVPTQLFGEGRIEPSISWVGQVNISTSPVPVAGGNITVTFYAYIGGTSSVIAYNNNAFSITGEEEVEIGESIQYQLEQTGNYSVNYDDGFVIYGDGPQQYSDSALRTGTGVDAWTQGGWYRRGSVTDWDFSELFTREVMEFQVGFVRNMQARLLGDYSPTKTLVYDNTNFFFIGGGFNAYTGEWNANFVANSFSSATATLTTNLISGNIGLGTGIYTSIANAVNQSLESGGLIAYRLAVQLNPGSISQLIVTPNIDTPFLFETGMSLRVVHPVTQKSVQFTVSDDQLPGSNVISVVSKEIDSTYIVGSMVFLSQETLNAFISIGRNVVRIGAEQNQMGELATSVSGNVTSLDVNLFASIRSGEDFEMIDANTGVFYPFTSAGAYNAGVQTIAIEEAYISAVAGSYISGDSGMKQSELVVSPGGVLISVTREREKNAIAKLSTELGAGPGVTSLPITGAITIALKDNQVLTVEARNGQTQDFVVNGNQNITGASTSITVDSVTNLVDFDIGATVFFPAGKESARITVNAGEIDLRVEKNGVINAINISTEGTTIDGSKLTINASTTFSAGYNPVDGRWVAYQDTAPATRGSGDPLVVGDEWFETDAGNRLRTWNGTSWATTETLIDGNRIITGSIEADKIDVSDLFAQTITVTGSLSGSSGATAWTLDSFGFFMGQFGGLLATMTRTSLTFETDADPFSPKAIFGTSGITLEQSAGNTDFTVSNTGTVVSKSSVTANSLIVGTQTNKATISYTTNTARTLTIPNVGGNRTFAFINESQTFSPAQAFSSLATFQSGIELVGSGANVTITNIGTSTRTLTIPTLGGNRTFQFIDQAQTISGANEYTGVQTFRQDTLRINDNDNSNYGTLRYSNGTNQIYTFSGTSGTVITTGNQSTIFWTKVVATDLDPFTADGRVQLNDGYSTFWVPYMDLVPI